MAQEAEHAPVGDIAGQTSAESDAIARRRAKPGDGGTGDDSARRWLILGVVCLGQLMVVLDATVVNIALPTAQRDLAFSNADRQWVVTAYSPVATGLAFLPMIAALPSGCRPGSSPAPRSPAVSCCRPACSPRRTQRPRCSLWRETW
jgi:hypothetical protein